MNLIHLVLLQLLLINNIIQTFGAIKLDFTLDDRNIGHEKPITVLIAFGKQNDLLASGSLDSTIKIWNVTNGKLLHTLNGHFGYIQFLLSLKNDLLASSSSDGSVKLWDINLGALKKSFVDENNIINEVNVLTELDNSLLACGTKQGQINIWNIETSLLKNKLFGHTNLVTCLVSLGNGLLASASFDSTIKVWDLNDDGKIKFNFDNSNGGHSNAITELLLNENLISSSYDNTIKLWDLSDVNNLKLKETFDTNKNGHLNIVSCLANLENGYLASGSYDGSVKIWDLNMDQLNISISMQSNSIKWIYKILALQNEQQSLLLVSSLDITVKVLDLNNNGQLKYTFDSSVDLAVFKHRNLLATSAAPDANIKIWDLENGILKYSFDRDNLGHNSKILTLYYLNYNLISGAEDGTIKVWSSKTGKLKYTFNGHTSAVNSLTSISDWLIASGSSDFSIKLWDLNRGILLYVFEKFNGGHSNNVTSLLSMEYSNGLLLASASFDSTIKIWDLTNGQLKYTFDEANMGHKGPVSVLVKLRDSFLASGSLYPDCSIKIWNYETGRLEHSFDSESTNAHTGSITTLTTHKDYLFSGSNDYTVKVWNITSKQLIRTIDRWNGGQISWISCLVYLELNNEAHLAVGSKSPDSSIKIWNLITGKLTYQFDRFNGGHFSASVTSMALLADGKYLISGSEDKTIKLWDLSNGKLMTTIDALNDGHTDAISNIVIIDKNQFTTSSYDKSIKLWTLE